MGTWETVGVLLTALLVWGLGTIIIVQLLKGRETWVTGWLIYILTAVIASLTTYYLTTGALPFAGS